MTRLSPLRGVILLTLLSVNAAAQSDSSDVPALFKFAENYQKTHSAEERTPLSEPAITSQQSTAKEYGAGECEVKNKDLMLNSNKLNSESRSNKLLLEQESKKLLHANNELERLRKTLAELQKTKLIESQKNEPQNSKPAESLQAAVPPQQTSGSHPAAVFSQQVKEFFQRTLLDRDINKQVERVLQEQQRIESESKKLQAENRALQTQLNELQKSKTSQDEEKTALVSQHQQESQSLTEKITDLQQRNKLLETQLAQAQQENKVISTQGADADAKCDAMVAELTKQLQDSASQQEKNLALIAQRSNELKLQQEKIAVLNQRLTDLSGKPGALATAEDKQSYAVGAGLGEDILRLYQERISQGSKVSKQIVLAGLIDAFNGKYVLEREELDKAASQASSAASSELEKTLKQQSLLSDKYLAEFRKKPGVKLAPGGFWYQIEYAGDGEIKADATVATVLKEMLVDGTVIKDMEKGSKVLSLPLSKYPPVFQEAIRLLKNHGTITMVVPPQLAYGDEGYPPQIKPGATIIYRLRIADVEAPKP